MTTVIVLDAASKACGPAGERPCVSKDRLVTTGYLAVPSKAANMCTAVACGRVSHRIDRPKWLKGHAERAFSMFSTGSATITTVEMSFPTLPARAGSPKGDVYLLVGMGPGSVKEESAGAEARSLRGSGP